MNASEKNLKRASSICLDKMSSQLLWFMFVFSIITFVEGNTSIGEGCSLNDLRGLTSFKVGIQIDMSGRLAKWVGHSCYLLR